MGEETWYPELMDFQNIRGTLAGPYFLVVNGAKKKRTMSLEARAKIAAAQKARRAKVKGN